VQSIAAALSLCFLQSIAKENSPVGLIIGAMVADWLLSGKKWAGPRPGINFAGYGAWAVGFIIGILPFLPISDTMKAYTQPAALYSLVAGFIVYVALAKAGLQPKTEPVPVLTAEGVSRD
jgi:cytosine permease